MHRALYILEVLYNIFGHLCPPESHRIPNRKSYTRDLATLARTCRTFKEPALDVLWSELADISPLVLCLPDGFQSVDQRPPTRREWETLQSYARRVWNMCGYQNVSQCLWERLLSFRNPSRVVRLFPNLRSLCWQGTMLIPEMHIATSSLTTLDLYFANDRLDALKNFFNGVGPFCPNLKRLRIHVSDCRVDHEVISGPICLWKNLRVLDFHGVAVDPALISLFAKIPRLEYLTLTLIPGATDWIPHSGSLSVFSRLTHLEIASQTLEPIMGLLSCTRLAVLRHLIVVCLRRPSKGAFISYMTAARNACSPDFLVKFVFLNVWSLRFPIPNTLDDPSDDQLTLNDLRPCMEFVNLRELRLDIKWSVALTDDDLLTLVSAWQRMEILHLNIAWGWRTTGGITLPGLLRLLEKCRRLAVLCVAVQTPSFAVMPSLDVLDKVLVPTHPLRILVSDSDIEEADVSALVGVLVGLREYVQFSLSDCFFSGSLENAGSRNSGWRRVVRGVAKRLSELVGSGDRL